MCGPSSSEKQAQGSEAKLMNQLQGNYSTNFANQQKILGNINATLAPEVAAGPSQTGFSPAERAALNTQAIDTTGAANANAQRAAATQLSGRNDSGNNPTSGVDQAIKGSIASTEAGQLANEQLGITEADYATGRQNFNNAIAAEEGVAGQYNPNATAQAATQANQADFQEANTINEQSNQEQADIAGGITGLAEGALTFGAGAAGGGGFSGGLKALAGGF